MTATTALAVQDPAPTTTRLAELEEQIEQRLGDMKMADADIGRALTAIRDEKLYRPEYTTFKAYVQGRWEFTDGHARQLIGTARVVEKIESATPVAHLPQLTEYQARALVPIVNDTKAFPRVVKRLDEYAAKGKKITASLVTAEVAKEPEGVRRDKAARARKIRRLGDTLTESDVMMLLRRAKKAGRPIKFLRAMAVALGYPEEMPNGMRRSRVIPGQQSAPSPLEPKLEQVLREFLSEGPPYPSRQSGRPSKPRPPAPSAIPATPPEDAPEAQRRAAICDILRNFEWDCTAFEDGVFEAAPPTPDEVFNVYLDEKDIVLDGKRLREVAQFMIVVAERLDERTD